VITGVSGNIQWSIEVREACDGRFYAVVQVGGKKRITDNTYKTRSAAEAGGQYLLSKTLAALRGA